MLRSANVGLVIQKWLDDEHAVFIQSYDIEAISDTVVRHVVLTVTAPAEHVNPTNIRTWELAVTAHERTLEKAVVNIVDYFERCGHMWYLPVSTRTRNSMINANITTLERLSERTKLELSRVKNVGKKTIVELEKVMLERGFKFREERR